MRAWLGPEPDQIEDTTCCIRLQLRMKKLKEKTNQKHTALVYSGSLILKPNNTSQRVFQPAKYNFVLSSTSHKCYCGALQKDKVARDPRVLLLRSGAKPG